MAAEALEMLKYVLVGVNVLLFAVVVTLFASSPERRGAGAPLGDARGPKRALLVTAHPDDESMFFLPLLRSLQASDEQEGDAEWQTHLLVLSRGNFDGLGDVREAEMKACATFLGVNPERLAVLEDPALQDGMQNQWSAQHIADVVLQYVDTHGIDAVFTFDDYGVSGHPNHIAVFRGVREALRRQHERCDAAQADAQDEDGDLVVVSPPKATRVRGWALESTGILRKYIGVLDAALSFWLSGRQGETPDDSAFVFCFRPAWNYRAMALHRSQFVWYRRLFVAFSRYTFVNTFQPIRVADDSAKKDN